MGIIKVQDEWKNENNKYVCPYCDKEYSKKGISTHIWRMHGSGKNWKANNKGYEDGTRTAWNKGLTKESDDRVLKHSEIMLEHWSENDCPMKGKKHSEETKKQISIKRKKFLEENPHMVPYKLNHYSKGESYPEEYFRKLLEKNKVDFEQEVQVGLYSLDFLIGNTDLEIDGEQHYLDERIKESDIKRTLFLESKGFNIIRIRWSEYQKLSRNSKEKFINNLLKELGY